MREIKFRAWDSKKKKWLFGYDYKNLGGFSLFGETVMLGEWSHVLDIFLMSRDGYTPEDLVVMQYTGLKDKNGKEIYEGDIVKYKISAKERFTKGEVIFKDLAWVISGKYRDIKNNEEYMRCLDEDDELEVIGNIYENPELLK